MSITARRVFYATAYKSGTAYILRIPAKIVKSLSLLPRDEMEVTLLTTGKVMADIRPDLKNCRWRRPKIEFEEDLNKDKVVPNFSEEDIKELEAKANESPQREQSEFNL